MMDSNETIQIIVLLDLKGNVKFYKVKNTDMSSVDALVADH
jgi:hypothetical protein